jgi:hypothetical protein
MRAPVSRSRPLRHCWRSAGIAAVTTPARCERWRSLARPATATTLRRRPARAAGSPGSPGWTGVTRAGVSGRVAELVCVSVADQGPKRDVVARPGRPQCHVFVLGTTDRRQPRRDKRLERHHVRLAPGALGELDCLAGAPALRARESRTGPEAEAQIDPAACEVEIAAHHAPRRLELQRKLEQLLHAQDRHAVAQRPGMVSVRHREPGRSTRGSKPQRIHRGPVFRRMRRGDTLTDQRLSDQSVALIGQAPRRRRLSRPPKKLSGRSLRPGYACGRRRSCALGARRSPVRQALRRQLAIHFRPPSMGWVRHEGQRLRRYSQAPEGLRPRFQGACDSAERSPRRRRYETARVPSGAKWIGNRRQRRSRATWRQDDRRDRPTPCRRRNAHAAQRGSSSNGALGSGSRFWRRAGLASVPGAGPAFVLARVRGDVSV